jgi:hypothetical protein
MGSLNRVPVVRRAGIAQKRPSARIGEIGAADDIVQSLVGLLAKSKTRNTHRLQCSLRFGEPGIGPVAAQARKADAAWGRAQQSEQLG